MENSKFALNNKHFYRFIFLTLFALMANNLMLYISDNVIISIVFATIISLPLLLSFLNVNTFTKFDSREKYVKLNYNIFGIKVPYKTLAYSDISKTLIKKESRSSYRYGQNKYSKYKLYLRDLNNKNYLIYGPISDPTKIKKVSKELAACLELQSTKLVKKKRIKTYF